MAVKGIRALEVSYPVILTVYNKQKAKSDILQCVESVLVYPRIDRCSIIANQIIFYFFK